jgi:hypothetical protein
LGFNPDDGSEDAGTIAQTGPCTCFAGMDWCFADTPGTIG